MFDELGEGVFRRRYEALDLNIGVVIGEDGVLVVDTRASHSQADQFKKELSSLTDLPVRWVINTHWHWDHTFGNSRFPDVDLWGHERCREALADRGDEMKVGARRWLSERHHAEIDAVEIMAPNKTFSDRASIDIGRRIELTYHGLGHTDADIVIRVPDSDVAFMGDLVEEGAPPSFGDSYPTIWPLTLRLATEEMPGAIVPGHGDVIDPAFIRSQYAELVAVADLAIRCSEGEIAVEDAANEGPYPPDVMIVALERAVALSQCMR
jgi:glyoxylase-like metal-dependent hydrolase (beta-lactamase superfamily II)